MSENHNSSTHSIDNHNCTMQSYLNENHNELDLHDVESKDVVIGHQDVSDFVGYPYNEIDTNNLSDCKLNKEAFQKGIDEVSELAGKITALANVGVPPESALEYFASMDAGNMTFKLQSKLSKEANDANIKIAEINGENMAKQVF